jgi:uncharacterized protein
MAAELEMEEGCVVIDYPEKPRMMGLDLLMLRRSGAVERLTESGTAGLIDLPRVSGELYHTARAFRVFTMERREVTADRLLPLLELSADAARARLAAPEPLL